MDPRAMPYYSYGNPYYWGYSGYNTPRYSYESQAPAPRNFTTQVADNSQETQKQVSKDNEDKNKGLVAAVIFLAILLLIIVIALIIVGVLYQQKGQSQNTTSVAPATATTETVPSQTLIDFSVKRNDITYQQSMADPKSATFGLTCNLFCDMISNEWLEQQITADACKCLQLRPGSVVADIQLTANSSLGTPEYVLSLVRIAIPYKSTQDSRTDKIQASDIVIHGTTTAKEEPTKASGSVTGDATDSGITEATSTTTIFGFNVTRTDLQYSAEMADPTSKIFNDTSIEFCKMVITNWLQNQISLDTCRCVKFVPGSVTGTVHITVDNSVGSPTEIMDKARLFLPVMSTNDPRTKPVEASDIIIVE